MSVDPFNIVKEEVKKSINKTKSLVESYQAILNAKRNGDERNVDPASVRLINEIRTNMKSINWDLQDLKETIKIASKNPNRFNLTQSELESRNQFVEQATEFVQKTKQAFSIEFDEHDEKNGSGLKKPASTPNINIRIPDLISNTTKAPGSGGGANESDSDYDVSYTRSGNDMGLAKPKQSLPASAQRSHQQPENDHHTIQMQHHELFKEQDKSIDLISGRVSSLKNISQAMQNELDDQAQLLDEMGREMETADTRMNSVMKRITKVLHMSSDKRQWTMIGVLLLGIFILLILFAIL